MGILPVCEGAPWHAAARPFFFSHLKNNFSTFDTRSNLIRAVRCLCGDLVSTLPSASMHPTLAAFSPDQWLARSRGVGGWFRLEGHAVAAEVLRELSPVMQRAVGCEQGGTNLFYSPFSS